MRLQPPNLPIASLCEVNGVFHTLLPACKQQLSMQFEISYVSSALALKLLVLLDRLLVLPQPNPLVPCFSFQ